MPQAAPSVARDVGLSGDVPKSGTLYNNDYSFSGSMLGSPYFGKLPYKGLFVMTV